MIRGYGNAFRALEKDPELGRLLLGYFVIAVTYNFTEAAIRTSDLVWIAFLLAVLTVPETVRDSEHALSAGITTSALAEMQEVI
jgi:hypothetical protein